MKETFEPGAPGMPADHSPFYNVSALPFPIRLPLAEEAHVATWRSYRKKGQKKGVWETLRAHLVQLQFPIQAGIKESADYRAATRRGQPASEMGTATGLELTQPDQLQLHIHESIAGPIPVLITPNHTDFTTLVRAFTAQNEPVPVPESMGACMVAGYNNWDRIHAYRAEWAAKNSDASDFLWQMELRQQLLPQKHLYQDRFVILNDGPYSGVAAADMGLEEETWRQLSLRIRLEHECSHYFTKRLFGEMRNHPFDELLADYRGIVAAAGYYRADWFLRFMGLEAYPRYRQGGRLQNYVSQPDVTTHEFQLLQTQVKAAAENLERFDAREGPARRDLEGQALMLLAICCLTLTELAATGGDVRLEQALTNLKERERGNVL